MSIPDTPDTAGRAATGDAVRAVMRRAAPGVLVLVYWALTLYGLGSVPRVYEDEPWQASVGWKVAAQGVFGSDLFAGYYGMERHYYGFMPLHPYLLAILFRASGVGLFQARLETVFLGALGLALTYALGRRLYGARVGVLALVFMLGVRWTALSATQVLGIAWLDISRIARYDMVVPVGGLATWHACLNARGRSDTRWHLVCGVLAALTGLGHVYGCFWFGAVLVLWVWERARVWQVLAGVLGFSVPWAVYGAYVLSGWSDWVGQVRGYGARFQLFDVAWYIGNVLAEPRRYALEGLGAWALVACVVCAGGALVSPMLRGTLWRAVRGRDEAARALGVPLVLFPLLFATLIHMKFPGYLATWIPLAALAAAWGACALWAHGGWGVRGALALALVGVLSEGGLRYVALRDAVAQATPYVAWNAAVRAHVPLGARVLGLHTDWFGFERYEYLSWWTLVSWTERDYSPAPVTLGEGLRRVAPTVILIDGEMRAHFAGRGQADGAQWEAWRVEVGATRSAVLTDTTYGTLEIFSVPGRLP